MEDQVSVAPPVTDGRREGMRAPDEVAAMLRLHALGWGDPAPLVGPGIRRILSRPITPAR